MKRRLMILVLLLMLVPLITAEGQVLERDPSSEPENPDQTTQEHVVGSAPMPEIVSLPRLGAEYPYWVRADQLFLPDGRFDPALLSPGTRHFLKSLLQDAEKHGKEECVTFGEVGSPPRDLDLMEVMKRSEWVFVGRVTGKAPGIASKRPLTLYRVLPERVLKGPQWTWEHFLTLPARQITLGGKLLCSVTSAYAPYPEVGEEALFLIGDISFSSGEVLDEITEANYLSSVGPESVIPLRDGSLTLPPVMKAKPELPQTKSALDSWLGQTQLRLGEGDTQ